MVESQPPTALNRGREHLAGRFAPSPTGPLHMGSLITALASYCDIKQRGGSWHIRIDDIDPQRAAVGALQHIRQALAAHGLLGDAPIRYQSQRLAVYQAARQQLADLCYYCNCSRKSLQGLRLYPGNCRHKSAQAPDQATDQAPDQATDHALRILADRQVRSFEDGCKGSHDFVASTDFGDIVIWRRDGLVTYHLATAHDDALDYSHVVRGDDLFTMTAPQIFLMDKLNLKPPLYAHIPVLTYADGTKLSKQTHAPALNNAAPVANLGRALWHLGQLAPPQDASVVQCLEWAVAHWQLDAVPAQLAPFQEQVYR